MKNNSQKLILQVSCFELLSIQKLLLRDRLRNGSKYPRITKNIEF